MDSNNGVSPEAKALLLVAEELKKNTDALRLLTARNPRDEFMYGSSWSGSSEQITPSKRVSSSLKTTTQLSAANRVGIVFSSPINQQGIRLKWVAVLNSATTNSLVTAVFMVEFSNDGNTWPNGQVAYAFPKMQQVLNVNQSLATGDVSTQVTSIFDEYFPVRYRFQRVSFMNYNATTGTFTAPTSALGTNPYSPIVMEYYGE